MNKPRSISSGDAMRWNEEVERRRRDHHERRCSEDALYRKAYEYLQAEERWTWENMHKPFAQMMEAEAEQRRVIGETKDGHRVLVPIGCAAHQMPKNIASQPVNDCMKDADKPQRIKTHEEVLREQAAMDAFSCMSDAEKVADGGNALAMGLIGMMFAYPEALQQRMKELEELKPYIDEIRETDKRFKNEEIRLSGFEW